MPRYAYQKPVNRVYSYNKDYMQNYYRPLTHYIETKSDAVQRVNRAPSEQPGHQSLAERLKTFPMDGSIYRSARAASAPPSRPRHLDNEDLTPMTSKASAILDDSSVLSAGRRERAGLEVSDEQLKYVPIWMKHPYRLPVEDIHVPPHESSIWPESVPHFNLVSSYDAMIGYLGLKHPLCR